MIDGISAEVQGGGIVGIAVGIISAVLALRRRVSTDNTIISQQQVERKSSADLFTEMGLMRNDARRAWDERNEQSEEVGGLRAENKQMRDEIVSLRRRVASLKNEIGIGTEIMPPGGGGG